MQRGAPSFAIVGLADRACQEAKHRVRSGITSAELHWPGGRIVVNLAPAELRKEGSGFDLPIALAILAASPVLWRDVLLLPMDNVGDSFLAGLDRATGVNRWRAERPKELNWATPLVRTAGAVQN